MLSGDLPRASALRHSSAIDVYAAASVVYELAAGHPPFAGVEGESPYRIKSDNAPVPLVCCHEAADELAGVLPREPEVALACAEVAQQLSLAPESPEVREALVFADAQLAPVLSCCLAADQKLRPSAAAVRRALAAFAETYAENIGHSMRREPLEACPVREERVLGRRARLRSAQALVTVAWVGAIAFAAYANTGAWVAVGWDSTVLWSGNLSSAGIALLLAAPAPVALAARGRWAYPLRSLVRAGVALAACTAVLLALVGCTAFAQVEVARGIVATVLLAAAAVWAWLVLGWVALQPAEGLRPRPLPAGGAKPRLSGARTERPDGPASAGLEPGELEPGEPARPAATPVAPTLASTTPDASEEETSHE